MFDLNFKEDLKEVITDEVSGVIGTQVDKLLDEEPFTVDNYPVDRPLHTDKYEELINTIKHETKKQIVITKQKGENLFSAKSVITTLAFLLTSVLIQVDVALADNKFTNREGIQLAITLIGAISTVAARGSEGSDGVYTNNFLPGLNKSDYDNDGILNDDDDTPWG